ncbi:hypothetical protein ACFVVM_08685 [Nocardia sp. NPDC058176]|uniref:hypothetical protein n=1 Tax=Nocardia sp. NPDC058176 TaxID=3346368 RepID=UPI0036D9872C
MNQPNDPDSLRRARDQARLELSEVVAELTDQLDKPADENNRSAEDLVTDAKYQALYAADQARDKADKIQAQAKEKSQQIADKLESAVPAPLAERAIPSPRLPVVAGAALLAAITAWLLARRRRT